MATTTSSSNNIIVIGGGLGGLMSTIRAVEAGLDVDLFSLVPARRSHSVCAQGGINAAKNLRGEGDSPAKHFDESVYGGDFLANQPLVKDMAEAAPHLVDLLDRMGVMFNRTSEGFLDFRRFGGTLFHRTAFSGATTGQQMIYSLDEQVRHWESLGRVRMHEFWEMLDLVIDEEGTCRGIIAQDLRTMAIESFRSDVVVLATGGLGMIFGRSTNSTICTGAAGARAHLCGARYANPEFIQVHPTAIPGADKLRLMSESARGEGGRVWVPKDPKDARVAKDIPESARWYFLEERYPTYGNLVPRDIASREIFKVCSESRGIAGQRMVYLDLTHISVEDLNNRLGGILDIYEKFVGEDPRRVPMKVFPAVHYSMGGLWVDYVKDAETGGVLKGHPRNHMTNIPGLYAVGEADYQYHGANRLGANSLLSCLYGGTLVGPSTAAYLTGLKRRCDDVPSSLYQAKVERQKQRERELLARDGKDNPYVIWRELGESMTLNATVVRDNAQLAKTEEKVIELQQRLRKAAIPDKGGYRNQALTFTRGLEDMMVLARTIVYAATLRDECRGSHYKPKFELPPVDSDDPAVHSQQVQTWCKAFKVNTERWLKTTVADFTGVDARPKIDYQPVDTSLIPPRPRTYGLKGAKKVEEAWAKMSRADAAAK
ncbi:MAG: succinate dehydrogenase flavoprotein subunit [Phycisphaerae bacterium]|nr:succinate dehydrogenase flavoprotein subunit [Phycisphaerae bacterium]